MYSFLFCKKIIGPNCLKGILSSLSILSVLRLTISSPFPHAMAPSGDLLLTALIPGKSSNIIWWVNQWLDFGWLVVKSILQNSRKNEWVAQKRQALPTQLIIDWLGGITTTTANKSIQKVKTLSFPPTCACIFSRPLTLSCSAAVTLP